jgi:hypothetical protein
LMSAYLISQDFRVRSLFFNKIMLLCTPLWLIVEVLSWPAQGPDLSPIENVWAIMKEKTFTQAERINSI